MISDALPIKFWPSEERVFNKRREPGIDFKPYFQKIKNDQNIRLQFIDVVERDYRLTIYDRNSVEVYQIPFDVVEGEGYFKYELAFTFSDLSLTNQKLRLKISYFENQINGAFEDLLESAAGTIVNIVVHLIDGAFDDLLEGAAGTIVQSQLDGFGVGEEEIDVCGGFDRVFDSGPYYWPSDEVWGTGVFMFTDPGRLNPLVGFDYISRDGEIFNLNDSTGEVEATTGNVC